MSLLISPESDAPIDHLKLHRDLSWVIKSLVALIVIGFIAGVWATTLAEDVKQNTEELDKKATIEQLASVAETLKRIEGKIDDGGKEQKTISNTVIRLETKVEALEEKVNN
jgi:hypothetical protein